jgi:predicted HTH domain antitoxin
VLDIVVWHEKRGLSRDEILDLYPGLTLADVYAALTYYFDHPDEIESDIQQEMIGVAETGEHYPAEVRNKLSVENGEAGEMKDKTIQLEIPEAWLQDFDPDQSTMLHEVIRLGIYQLKVQEALEIYKAGHGSIGYAAEKAGISKRDLVREARSRGIEPPFDQEMVQEELAE